MTQCEFLRDDRRLAFSKLAEVLYKLYFEQNKGSLSCGIQLFSMSRHLFAIGLRGEVWIARPYCQEAYSIYLKIL